MTPSSEKQIIRKSILAARNQLGAGTRAAYSAEITAKLLQMPEYRQAGTILGYMSFGAEFVSDTWIERVLTEGRRLALPKVNRHGNHLDLYWVEDPESQLMTGLWGIREPIVERCQRLGSTDRVEFALLPGVAFTRCGARLGYGGGYYDRLLAGMVHRPLLVAAAFALQVVEYLPQETTDIGMCWLVTERETLDCLAHGLPVITGQSEWHQNK